MTLPAVLVLAGLAAAYVAAVYPTAARRRRERAEPSAPIEPRTPFDDAPRSQHDDLHIGLSELPEFPDLPDAPNAD